VGAGATTFTARSQGRASRRSLIPIPFAHQSDSPGWRAAQFRSSAILPTICPYDEGVRDPKCGPGANASIAVVGRLQHVFGGQTSSSPVPQGKKNPSEHQNLDFRLDVSGPFPSSGSRPLIAVSPEPE